MIEARTPSGSEESSHKPRKPWAVCRTSSLTELLLMCSSVCLGPCHTIARLNKTSRSGSKEVFKVDGIKLRHQDATKTITVTPGEIRRIP